MSATFDVRDKHILLKNFSTLTNIALYNFAYLFLCQRHIRSSTISTQTCPAPVSVPHPNQSYQKKGALPSSVRLASFTCRIGVPQLYGFVYCSTFIHWIWPNHLTLSMMVFETYNISIPSCTIFMQSRKDILTIFQSHCFLNKLSLFMTMT